MLKLNARDCVIKEISKDAQKDFLNTNHLQGYAKANVCYGLYFREELVQLMSFGKPRFNKNYQWEIIRDCTKKDCIVRGGVSKLWKHFLENNRCRSCICYSYPHELSMTNKYIDHCGFKNISKSANSKNVSYVGKWNGKEKTISKSLLVRYGVDGLLGTNYGKNYDNEDLLLELGFEKIEEDGATPQVDIYYPFGVVYRVDDLTDGTFYVGMCEAKDQWDNGYLGSGTVWKRHLDKHPNKTLHKNRRNSEAHIYRRTIIKSDFNTPKETRDCEVEEINKFFIEENGICKKTDSKCMNCKTFSQSTAYIPPVCPECGGKMGRHKKTCSKYAELDKCPECGLAYNQHKITCSHYTGSEIICPECGGRLGRHKRTCSMRKQPKPCPECGAIVGHKSGCSKSKSEPGCTCGTPIGGFHKKSCPLYKEPEKCPECGKASGHHAKTCSHYKNINRVFNVCPECGAKVGHKLGCSHRKKENQCPECGSIRVHKAWCSHRKEPKVCEECGGIGGRHYKTCSHYVQIDRTNIICPECGGKQSKHKKTCSKYEHKVCPVCGSIDGHVRGCPNSSKYKHNPSKFDNICPECGFHSGYHSSNCSKVSKTPDRICKYCGGINGEHKDNCKARSIKCPECGKTRGHHAITCSHCKICPICGGRDGRHRAHCEMVNKI